MSAAASTHPTAGDRSVVADFRAVRAGSRALAASLSSFLADAETAARDRVVTRPYATLAMAVGIGYVLGGGLPLRLTALLVSLGTRVAFEAATRELSARLAARTSAPA